jgi:hypothetical protein
LIIAVSAFTARQVEQLLHVEAIQDPRHPSRRSSR